MKDVFQGFIKSLKVNKMEKGGRPRKRTAEAVVKDIRRQTRRKFNSEEKIRIVLEGLKGEESISEICGKEGIAPALYYPLEQGLY